MQGASHMQKGIAILLLGLGLSFSQSAISAEMIRYEHDMYQNKISKPRPPTQQNAKENKTQQPTKKSTDSNKRVNKQGHPVHIAFPDRN